MTTTQHRVQGTIPEVLLESDIVTHATARRALGGLRIAFGLTFLWAFFDKLLALGFSTGAITDATGAKTGIDFFSKDAWIHGGNPTLGFLQFGSTGPFKGFYNSIAGQGWVNWAFMLALLALGVALTFGIGMRLATAGGFVLYLMLWSVALLPSTNPAIDDHIIGALVMIVFAVTMAGDTWGLGKKWAQTKLVRRYSVLR
jgi:thiosulfate dehydrogenase [quinone] large subunit